MRIISEFKDYYDSVQATGYDSSFAYIRTEKSEEIKKEFLTVKRLYLSESSYTIGFCGKVYPCIELNGNFCYSLKDFEEALDKNYDSKDLDHYYDRPNKKKIKFTRQKFSSGNYGINHKTMEQFFNRCKEQQNNYLKIFEDNYCPIFIVSHAKSFREKDLITYNARLNLYEFYRVFDPYQAFQEISMFLGGLASPEKELPKLDDKTMSEIKGFNKFSFRKDKSKK